MKKTILFILLSIFFINCAIAAPQITDNSNDVTNDDSIYPVVEYGSNINFEITANESIDTYTWYVDGSSVANNYDNLTQSFNSAFHHNVTVIASNVNGDDSFTWYPVVQREAATTTSNTANETAYNDMLDSFDGTTDFEGFLLNSTLPFTDVIGSMFFVFLWGMYFVMSWIRQESVTTPAIVGMIVGIVLFAWLPEDFAVASVPLILLGATAMIYSLYKER